MKSPARRTWIPLLAALVVVTAPAAQSASYAYVASRYGATVAVIDTSTHAVVATITVGDGPMAASVSPDGSRVYVTIGPRDEVAVIDTASNSVVDRIPVGDNPTGVEVSPQGDSLYVVNTGDRTLSIIDTALGEVLGTVALGNHPIDVAVHPDGHAVYVSGDYPGDVSVVDPVSATVIATIPVGDSLGGLAVHPSGLVVYVVNSGNDELAIIDATELTLMQRVTVGERPVDVAVHPGGGIVYVTNLFGTGPVSVIDTGDHSVVHTIMLPGPALAQGAAVTPDGRTLYVALRGVHGVLAVDTNGSRILGIIPVGGEPTGFGRFIGPDASASGAVTIAQAAPYAGTPTFLAAADETTAPGAGGEVAVEVPIDLMPGAAVSAGDDVVFANNECLFVLDFDTAVETPIIGRADPSNPARPICDDPRLQPIRHASVSRDRKRMLFNVGEDFSGQVETKLFLIDLPSRRVYELLPGFARVGVGGIDFAPNGDMYFAGVSLGDASDPRVAERSEVFRIAADLGLWEQVTDLPNRGVADVSVSPDGTKLAFNTLVLTTNNIEVMQTDIDGANPKVIVQGGAVWLDSVHDPEHSPDSSKVVYSRMRVRMPDGSVCGPNWSHGGPRCHDIHVRSVDGRSSTIISPIGDTSIVPDWKGHHIVYAFSRGNGTSPGSWIGSMVTDENGFTLIPFGSYNLFAKWID